MPSRAGHAPLPGGYVIGFHSEHAAARCAAASAALVALAVAARVARVAALAPFEAGIQTYGASGGFVALLVLDAGRWSDGVLGRSAARFYAAVAVAIVAGEMAPLRGLANTAYVFLYLKALADVARVASQRGAALAIFLVSLLLVTSAAAAHRHAAALGALLARLDA
jgi:hypothetical protein